jgi:hypothetical protein
MAKDGRIRRQPALRALTPDRLRVPKVIPGGCPYVPLLRLDSKSYDVYADRM